MLIGINGMKASNTVTMTNVQEQQVLKSEPQLIVIPLPGWHVCMLSLTNTYTAGSKVVKVNK